MKLLRILMPWIDRVESFAVARLMKTEMQLRGIWTEKVGSELGIQQWLE